MEERRGGGEGDGENKRKRILRRATIILRIIPSLVILVHHLFIPHIE